MSDEEWVDLGPAAEVPAEGVVLRKDDAGRRYAAFRVDDSVRVLDDRCPHEGYPLSQGELRNGVLTCAWHNWKFDACSGDCVFGGEAVRSHPVRVDGGRVLIDVAVDVEAERARLLASMGRTLREVDTTSALRDALRLSALEADGPALSAAFAAVVGDGARRAPWGFDHPLAMTADLCRWAEAGWVDGAAALSLSITAIAEEGANLDARPVAEAEAAEGSLFDDLVAERHREAEARARGLARAEGPDAVARALLPFVALHLLDYGHGAIYLAKANELVARFPTLGTDVYGALAQALCWATRETSLPPWGSARRAMSEVDEMKVEPTISLADEERARYEEAVLAGEREAAEATVSRLAEAFTPESLLWATARAAARRLLRFDDAWEARRDSNVSVLNVTHTVTFAEACLALLPHASAKDARRLAVQAAAFVGKVRKGDGEVPEAADGASLADALRHRDVSLALGAVRGLNAEERAEVFVEMAPFAAFEMAVRPIRYAHGIKMTESLFRLHQHDPEPDPVYLHALLAYVVPRRPERDHRRFAEIARRFLEDGRPPPGLY